MKPWDSWEKPWSKEQCEMRYVQGDRISVSELAKISGRAHRTIGQWSSDGKWTFKRDQFQINVVAISHEKTAKKTAEKLSDQLSEIAIANYQALKLQRDYAMLRMQIIAKDAKRIQTLPQEQQLEAAEKSTSNNTLDTLSKMMARAIAGINESVGLKYYVDLNAAIEKAIREGYMVSDPNEEE